MPNITLALDAETHAWVKLHTEVRWSEVARQAIERKIRELHTVDAAFADSNLDEEDIEQLTREAKKRLLERLETNDGA